MLMSLALFIVDDNDSISEDEDVERRWNMFDEAYPNANFYYSLPNEMNEVITEDPSIYCWCWTEETIYLYRIDGEDGKVRITDLLDHLVENGFMVGRQRKPHLEELRYLDIINGIKLYELQITF